MTELKGVARRHRRGPQDRDGEGHERHRQHPGNRPRRLSHLAGRPEPGSLGQLDRVVRRGHREPPRAALAGRVVMDVRDVRPGAGDVDDAVGDQAVRLGRPDDRPAVAVAQDGQVGGRPRDRHPQPLHVMSQERTGRSAASR